MLSGFSGGGDRVPPVPPMPPRVLHVAGAVLAGPDDVRGELWVVGGRVSYSRPPGMAADDVDRKSVV